MEAVEDIAWDVAVIGGGPAGMMAAGRAAELGARVLLVEKNATLGKKLLITGGGRCNVCNAEEDTRALLAKFKDSDKFLFSAFSQWSTKETLEFFHSRGMETKVEPQLRVFPKSNNSQSVWDTMVNYMKEGKVTILSNAHVINLAVKNDRIVLMKLKNRKEIHAKKFIIATGGKSRPETGSTGDGYGWLASMGHTVSESSAALVPLTIKDAWVKELAGISIPEVKITAFQNGEKQNSKVGRILFTHLGVSGPTILNMSHDIGELLKYGEVRLELDFAPTLGYDELNTKLQEVFAEHSNKKLKNSLSGLIPSALVPMLLGNAGIDGDIACNSTTRESRLQLVQAIKHAEMKVEGLLGLDKAVITSGGVALTEVDFKTMQSRLFSNLYLVGDILNIDRPSGGYSLQMCWTTGHVAGTHAAQK